VDTHHDAILAIIYRLRGQLTASKDAPEVVFVSRFGGRRWSGRRAEGSGGLQRASKPARCDFADESEGQKHKQPGHQIRSFSGQIRHCACGCARADCSEEPDHWRVIRRRGGRPAPHRGRISDATHQPRPPRAMVVNTPVAATHSPTPGVVVADLECAAGTDSSRGDCNSSSPSLEWDYTTSQ